MRSLVQFAALALAPLLVAATCNQPSPVGPGGAGGSSATGGASGGGGVETAGGGGVAGSGWVTVDGYLACIAAATASEGVRNVAAQSGRRLADAVESICSSPVLRDCYAGGRCK